MGKVHGDIYIEGDVGCGIEADGEDTSGFILLVVNGDGVVGHVNQSSKSYGWEHSRPHLGQIM